MALDEPIEMVDRADGTSFTKMTPKPGAGGNEQLAVDWKGPEASEVDSMVTAPQRGVDDNTKSSLDARNRKPVKVI